MRISPTCVDQFEVGDRLKCPITGYDVGLGQAINANMATQVMSANESRYTLQETYENIPFVNSTVVHT